MTKIIRREPTFGVPFLQKGLNVTDNAIMVPFQNMVDSLNILVGSTWARRSRGALAYFSTNDSDENEDYPLNPKNNAGDPGGAIIGAKHFWRDNGSGIVADLLIRQGTRLWAIPDRTSIAVDITGTLVLDPTGQVCFQPYFGGVVYFCSTEASDGLCKWDGVSAAAVEITGPPDGVPNRLSIYRGRVAASGVEGFPFTLYLSATNDGDNWTIPDVILASSPTALDFDFYEDPVGIVTHLPFQDNLYVFLRRAVYVLTGDDATNFWPRPVAIGIGAISANCVLPIGNEIYFLSERGLQTLSSSDVAMRSEYGLMSRDISKLYHEGLDHSREQQWTMQYDERENLILISCTSLGSVVNDVVLAYNTEKGVWNVWGGINARTLIPYLDNRAPRLLAGREDGILALLGDPSRVDFGTVNYPAGFTTGVHYPGETPDEEHIFEEITILCSSKVGGSLTMQVMIDEENILTYEIDLSSGSGDQLDKDFVLGSSELSRGNFTPYTVETDGRGFGVQIAISYPPGQDVEVYGFVIGSRPAGQKRYL